MSGDSTGVRWGGVAVAAAIGILAIVVCGTLGWWQWSRAQTTGATVLPEPPAPLATLVSPAESAGAAVGRQATVTGTWADEEAAIVPGREVDGVPAQILVRALTVPAAEAGSGDDATLAVVVGWAAEDADAPVPGGTGAEVTLTGYLRAPEATAASSLPTEAPVDGAFWASALATSELAQVWPPPLYTTTLVAAEGDGDWTALDPPPPTTELNFRSAAYAIEWWLFGAFAAFVAGRWIRDNGRARPESPDAARDTTEDDE